MRIIIATLALTITASCAHQKSGPNAQPGFARGSADIATVAERTLPSVVNISSVREVQRSHSPFSSDPAFRRFFRHFFGQRAVPQKRRKRSLGSGVIVSADGIVLTNNHVVRKAAEIKCHLHDGRELLAKVVGTDPKSDLAVLKLQGELGELKPIAYGDSDRLRLGDVVLAIGNPFGVGQTVTMGIVSAKGRANMGIVDYEDFIQTDAAINPGNSGGALVDMSGTLVGINTAILSRSGGYQGIGFAIPSNMAKAIQRSIVTHGKVVRGYLGVALQELSPQLAQALGVKGKRGVLVADVRDNSPAARAGIKRGDVIVAIGQRPTTSPGILRNLVATLGDGARIKIALLRQGRELLVEAQLGELASAGAGGGGAVQLAPGKGALGGLTIAPLDDTTRNKHRVPARLRGVLVSAVAPDSPASRSGVQPGDVLLELNRRPIDSVKMFHDLYREAAVGQKLLVLVFRRGRTFYLLLR